MIPVVLYWYETWLSHKRKSIVFSVFESLMLKKIFAPVMDKVRVCWRKLHNEELQNLYSPQVVFE
jgi:hypothetical protein